MKIIKCPAFVFFLDIFLNNFLVGTRKCLLLNISVKKRECGPPKFTNREVYSERKRKKNYVEFVSFVPFLYQIKVGEGSADTSHVNLSLPLTSISSCCGGDAKNLGATAKRINKNIISCIVQ